MITRINRRRLWQSGTQVAIKIRYSPIPSHSPQRAVKCFNFSTRAAAFELCKNQRPGAVKLDAFNYRSRCEPVVIVRVVQISCPDPRTAARSGVRLCAASASAADRRAASARRLGSSVSGSWFARWCSARVRSSTCCSSTACWARNSPSTALILPAMALKASASSAISPDPPPRVRDGALAGGQPAGGQGEAAHRQRDAQCQQQRHQQYDHHDGDTGVHQGALRVVGGLRGTRRRRGQRRARRRLQQLWALADQRAPLLRNSRRSRALLTSNWLTWWRRLTELVEVIAHDLHPGAARGAHAVPRCCG